MTETLKAIQTRWKGRNFRSRTEARWAVVFDTLGLDWEYEPQGFETPDGPYLPDFYIPSRKLWIETKPLTTFPKFERLYLAGKMEHQRKDLHLGFHLYAGPDWTNDHGCDQTTSVVQNCLIEIQNCTTLLAYIDRDDVHGTLAEIGYAQGLGKNVIVAFGDEMAAQFDRHDGEHGSDRFGFPLWFIRDLADRSFCAASFQEAINHLIPPLDAEQRKTAWLSQDGNNRSVILRGSPYPDKFFYELYIGGRPRIAANLLGPILNVKANDVLGAISRGGAARFEHGEQP